MQAVGWLMIGLGVCGALVSETLVGMGVSLGLLAGGYALQKFGSGFFAKGKKIQMQEDMKEIGVELRRTMVPSGG